jgi:hypothetical protein
MYVNAILILASSLLQTPPEKTMNFLILGYVAMWLIGAVYVASLANRQRNLQQDVKLMQRLLAEDEESS